MSPAIKKKYIASTLTLIHQTDCEIPRKLIVIELTVVIVDEDVQKLRHRELYSQHTLFVIHQTNTAAVGWSHTGTDPAFTLLHSTVSTQLKKLRVAF